MPAGIYVRVAIGAFVAIVVVVFAALAICRRRPLERSSRHESHPLKGSYAVLLACVAAVLLYLTATTDHKVGMLPQDHPSVVIEDGHSRGVMHLAPMWDQIHHGPSASPSSRRLPADLP